MEIPARADVVIVGGGISGLAAARHLVAAGYRDVTVVEAGERWGGRIWTGRLGDALVERGAEAILTGDPRIAALCEELGLALEAPSTAPVAVWHRGRVRSFPPETSPTQPGPALPLLRRGLIDLRAAAGLQRDRRQPARPGLADESVGDLARRHWGRRYTETMVRTLVSAVYACDADRLSAAIAMPHLLARSRGGRLGGDHQGPGLRDTARTVAGGMSLLVDRLVERLAGAGVQLAARTAVDRVMRDGSGWRVITAAGEIHARAVLLTVPPAVAAAMLGRDTETALLLLRAASAPLALVLASWSEATLPDPPGGNGFLLPPAPARQLRAVTWTSRKWPQTAPPGTITARLSLGGAATGAELLAEDDDAITAGALEELSALLPGTGTPQQTSVVRWPEGLPVFSVGHHRWRAALAAAAPPGLALAGTALAGPGIAGCIAAAESAAAEMLSSLAAAGSA